MKDIESVSIFPFFRTFQQMKCSAKLHEVLCQYTLEPKPFAASSCIVVWLAPGCLGPQGTHIPSGVFMKNIASCVLRTGSNRTSLTCQ